MIQPKPYSSASTCDDFFCVICGWPIVHVCCNDGMSNPPYGGDYWAYCSNKSCENHAGEDWGQGDPEIGFRSDVAKKDQSYIDRDEYNRLKKLDDNVKNKIKILKEYLKSHSANYFTVKYELELLESLDK